MSKRRISFFGGPGIGKSTIAAKTFAELKMQGYDVEQISEYIKQWAHEGKKPVSYDQLYVFAKQLKVEDTTLRNVQHLVTDSPVLMNAAYTERYGFSCASELVEIALDFESKFPSYNILLERTVDYIDKGRYENHQQALEFDQFLLDFLDRNLGANYVVCKVSEFDKMMDGIKAAISQKDNDGKTT